MDNILVNMIVIKFIVVEKFVGRVLISFSYFVYRGDFIYFFIFFEEFGIDLCFRFDF